MAAGLLCCVLSVFLKKSPGRAFCDLRTVQFPYFTFTMWPNQWPCVQKIWLKPVKCGLLSFISLTGCVPNTVHPSGLTCDPLEGPLPSLRWAGLFLYLSGFSHYSRVCSSWMFPLKTRLHVIWKKNLYYKWFLSVLINRCGLGVGGYTGWLPCEQ